MEYLEPTKQQLKFLIALWLATTIIMLIVGYTMVIVSFPTTPLYGKFISSIVFLFCISFAVGRLLRYINKLK